MKRILFHDSYSAALPIALNSSFFETDKSELQSTLDSENVTGFVIDITQPYTGRMVILGDKDLFSAVTEQFFGTTSPPGTSDPLHDIGCELANTIAGHFMA